MAAKKTRRRLRVSCVECTRRRQKCDRKQPCGLCVSRGVVELCKWEDKPYARPPPARPPGRSSSSGHLTRNDETKANTSTSSPIQMLSESPPQGDISTLSRPVSNGKHQDREVSLTPSSGDQETTDAAVAQLSGASRDGSSDGGEYYVHRPREQTDVSVTRNDPATDCTSSLPVLRNLIAALPEKAICDAMISSFFEQENWRFELPRGYIEFLYSKMWVSLQEQPASLDRVSIEWLTLLYAIFSLSSARALALTERTNPGTTTEEKRIIYYRHSLTGRRIVQDLPCMSFSSTSLPSTGPKSVYCCIAAVLLGSFLCEHGNASEAWIMITGAVHNAQAAGLHRDHEEDRSNVMHEDERVIRKIAWWLLMIHDGRLSFILGRPPAIRVLDKDVPLPKPPLGPLARDGTTDTNPIYQAFIRRCAALNGETCEISFENPTMPYAAIMKLDDKYEKWEMALPPYLSCCNPDRSLDDVYPKLSYQRSTLAIYYYAGRMILHRPYLYTQPPVLPVPCALPSLDELNPSRVKCISLAGNLIRAEKTTRNHIPISPDVQPLFTTHFFVFEAALTLSIALLQDPDNQSAWSWKKDIESAIEMLQAGQVADAGNVVRKALAVLDAIQKGIREIASQLPPGQIQPASQLGSTNAGLCRSFWGPRSNLSMNPPIVPLSSVSPLDRPVLSVLNQKIDELRKGSSAYELIHSID